MLAQQSQRLLYTVSTNQASLDAALIHSQHNSSSSSSSPVRLFKRVQLTSGAIDSTAFQPQVAAAAVVDGNSLHTHSNHQQQQKQQQQQQQEKEVESAGQQQVLLSLRAASPTLFIVYWHAAATEDAGLRWAAFRAGANMVTHCPHAVAAALQQVAVQQQQQQQQQHDQPQPQQPTPQPPVPQQQQQQQQEGASIVCEWCGLPGLTPAAYYCHQPLYHIDHENLQGVCQVCGRHTTNIARHLHDFHKPTGAGPETRTGVFALCMIRRPSDGKFLMTQEYAGAGFWVPGGGVDPGETLVAAAERECWEEAGVRVKLRGILAVESHHAGTWRRVIFWGEPSDAASSQLPRCCCPKTLPDFESAGACWVDASELEHLPLRSPSEPCKWFTAMSSGAAQQLSPQYHSLELPGEWREAFRPFAVV